MASASPLDRLVCPQDQGALAWSSEAALCLSCGRRYAIDAGVPVFFTDEEWDELYRTDQTHYSAEAPFQLPPGERGPLFYGRPEALDVILDLGCGDGVYSSSAPAGATVFGVDVTLTALRRMQLRQMEQLIPVAASGFQLPFRDETFDTVLSVFVVEHLDGGADERMLREVRRVAKRDGQVIVTTDTPFYDRHLVRWTNRLFGRKAKAQDWDARTGHVNLLTMRQARALVHKCGFTITREVPCWMGSRFGAWRRFVTLLRRALPSSVAEDFLTSSYTLVLRRIT